MRISPNSTKVTVQSHSASAEVQISQEELNELALWELNGREIKNVAKTAQLWCSYNKTKVTLSRLESTIKVTAPFAEKLGVAGGNETRTRKRLRRESDSEGTE
jgi:hypothetical protein